MTETRLKVLFLDLQAVNLAYREELLLAASALLIGISTFIRLATLAG